MSDLSNALKQGDIVNSEGIHWSWNLIDVAEGIIATNGISMAQMNVFCEVNKKAKTMRVRDSHTMMYFGPDQLFSVELPKPKYINVENNYVKGDTRIVSIYRMNPAYFGKSLDANDIAIMKGAADSIIAKNAKYDIGQLLDILIDDLTGYPYEARTKFFDQGQDRLVCSVGCASIIDSWRHTILQTTGQDIPQPWKKLNPTMWDAATLKAYPNHWDIGRTMPACYALTDTHFSNEFMLVGRFKSGKQIA